MRRFMYVSPLVVLSTILLPTLGTPALAQFDPPPAGKGPRLDKPFTERYQVGVKISAGSGACRGLLATIPIPSDWPEQQVKVDAEDIDKNVRSVRTTTVGGTVRQMAVAVPVLPAGQTANALVTYEITRYTLLPPEDTSIFQTPTKLTLAERRCLGQSPMIESRNGEVRAKVKEILADHQDAAAWGQVEAIYDWVRDNIPERRGKTKGALQALRDGNGNEEDLNSLFIALCRAAGVPARTVWVQDGSYAEFMLADDESENHWMPCRLNGKRAFGGIDSEMPILQKGDNFRVPQHREPVRFVPEYVKGAGGRPNVEFVRKEIPK